MTYCILVPHYHHERQFIKFLPELIATGLPCILVDDGSSPYSIAVLKKAIAPHPNVYFFEQVRNRGKGAAIKAGICHARGLGFTHAIQIDADGQHTATDIPKFIATSKQHPSAIICGTPVFDSSAPKARVYGRKITDFWVAIETLSTQIKDGLCGFRIYPITETEALIDQFYLGNRMDFDTELLVKAVWLNIKLIFLPTKVIYPQQSVSHFHYLRDNLTLIRLHVRLVLGMLPRFPVLLWRSLRRQ